jgi:hypothetical protein
MPHGEGPAAPTSNRRSSGSYSIEAATTAVCAAHAGWPLDCIAEMRNRQCWNVLICLKRTVGYVRGAFMLQE